MPVELIAQLILQFGLPFAEKMVKLWNDKTAVTPQVFAELKALSRLTPQTHLESVAASLGLPMTDPRISAVAELIKPAA